MKRFALLMAILIVIVVSGCTSSPTKSTVNDDTYTKTPTTSKPLIDATYERNAKRAASEALAYCRSNPYGTFRTTVYNGEGVGVPVTIEC